MNRISSNAAPYRALLPALVPTVISVSIGLYTLALFLPAYLFDSGFSISGGDCLKLGWLAPVGVGWVDPEPQLGWYANPLLLVAGLLLWRRKWRLAAILEGLALAVGLDSLTLREMLYDEYGASLAVTTLGIGAYFWFASMIVVILGAVAGYVLTTGESWKR